MSAIDFIPSVVNLNLYGGDGAAVQISARDEGGPVDLTGEMHAQIRQARDDADALVDWAANTDDAQNGVVVMSLSGEQTHSLMLDGNVQRVEVDGRLVLRFAGVWDVEWTPQDSEPMTLVQGDVTCVLDVTRR